MNAFREANPLVLENVCELELWMEREFSLKFVWTE